MPIETPIETSASPIAEAAAERFEDAPRQGLRILGGADAGLDDGELVAAEAGEGIGPAQEVAQAVGDLLDQLIARLMAIGVVDVLEAVKVEKEHGDPAFHASEPTEFAVEPLGEDEAVRQARERVAAEEVLGAFLVVRQFAGKPPRIVDEEDKKQDGDHRPGHRDRSQPSAHRRVARARGDEGQSGKRQREQDHRRPDEPEYKGAI